MKTWIALLPLGLAACADPIPEIGPGPFRGALLNPIEVDPLPVDPNSITEDVQVASAPARDLEAEVEAQPEVDVVTEEPLVEPPGEDTPEEETFVAIMAEQAAPEEGAEDTAVSEEEVLVDEEVVLLNFDDLADFDYTPPTLEEIENGTERPEQVPAEVLAYDKRIVEIEGYMIPIEVEKGKVQSFILSRTLSGCCFGDMPNIQEWVDVKMEEGQDADYIPYAPVLVIGKISVGEQVDEYGITSLYRMTAESVEDPW